jgi:hypothetical protein
MFWGAYFAKLAPGFAKRRRAKRGFGCGAFEQIRMASGETACEPLISPPIAPII